MNLITEKLSEYFVFQRLNIGWINTDTSLNFITLMQREREWIITKKLNCKVNHILIFVDWIAVLDQTLLKIILYTFWTFKTTKNALRDKYLQFIKVVFPTDWLIELTKNNNSS
jgi:hypothetical protein